MEELDFVKKFINSHGNDEPDNGAQNLKIITLEEKVRSLERENKNVLDEFARLLLAYKSLRDKMEEKEKGDNVEKTL